MALFRRRLRRDVQALQQGRAPIQPVAFGPAPIPTWSGDTVLRAPAEDGDDDRVFKARMFSQVIDIYRGSASLRGEERDDYIADRLRSLDTA